MAIILASMQMCSPLFFGFEHPACQLGTVAVFKPFPKPGSTGSRSINVDRKAGKNTGDNATNDELMPRQVLYAVIRF